MIDLPTTTPIVTEIFGSSDYRVWGSGGDLCLPGAIECQHLHSDGRDAQHLSEGRIEQAKRLGVELNRDSSGKLDVPTIKLIMEMTPPMVIINFLMCDLTWENGPIRFIPGTHTAQQPPPKPADEPEWMRHSTLVGAPAGAGVFRDNRTWHGATPNLSREIRAMPDVEYFAPWVLETAFKKTIPHEIFETLTPHAQKLCEWIKSEKGVWPAGAGIMHPLASQRAEAADSANGQILRHDGVPLASDGTFANEGAMFSVGHGPAHLLSESLETLLQNGWVCLASVIAPEIILELERISCTGRWENETYDRSRPPLNESAVVAKPRLNPCPCG